jgi:hypothetical protein
MYGSMVYAMTAVTDKSVIKEGAKKSIRKLINDNPGINIAEDAEVLAKLNNIIDAYGAYGVSPEDILSDYKPQISDLEIDGVYGAGNTLTLSYNFTDELGGRDASEYRWYKTDSVSAAFPDEYTLIDGANESTYTMQPGDDGYIIRGEVVPKTPASAISARPLENSPVISQTFFKEIAPSAVNVKISCDTEAKKIAAGSKLTVTYDYFDPNMIEDENIDVESGTQVVILKSADKTNWEILADLSGLQKFEYVLTDADVNVYLRAGITPKNNHAPEAETGEQAFSDIIAGPFAPHVSDVVISGTGRKGTTLECGYKFDDVNGNSDVDTEVVWYRSGREIGRGINYTVTDEDAGNKVYCIVTPKTDVAPTIGAPVESNRVSCSGSSSSGGSSSGGGGGSVKINIGTVTNDIQKYEETVTAPEYHYTYAFADIQNHWARDEIEKMYKKGIVSGKGDGFFPDDSLIRAEIAVLISNAAGIKEKYDGCFADVNETDWFSAYVQGLYRDNIMVGSDGNFMPYEAVTREMAAKIFVMAFKDKLVAADESDEINAPDKSEISDWAVDAVKTALKNGIIKGRDDGTIAPKDVLTRAEAVVMIDRLLEPAK